ncbi:MAG: glycosyltransferase family 4 protein [Candidatus Thorarchaeota archaeon]
MSESGLKLLMYSPLSLRMGAGGDRWLVEMAPRLMKRGIQPTVFATDFMVKNYRRNPTDWFVDQLVDSGIRYEEAASSSISSTVNTPLMGRGAFTQLSREMKNHDITYFMNAYFFQDVSTWMAKRLAHPAPVISAQHATLFQDNPFHNAYIHLVSRSLLRVFDAFHVLNKEDYLTYGRWGLSPAFLIPNGVDTTTFFPARSKDDEQFNVLYLGRLDHQKGIDTLLEAIQFIENKVGDGIVFKIGGTGPFREHVQRFVRNRPNVQYLGRVPEEDLVQVYNSASVFAMPSRRETFGLVALEAMACGTPVVVSDIPGPRSFIEESFARKMPPTNPKLLADAIEWFYHLSLEHPEEFKSMAKNARAVCVEKFDWEQISDRLSAVIKWVVAGKE